MFVGKLIEMPHRMLKLVPVAYIVARVLRALPLHQLQLRINVGDDGLGDFLL